MLDSKVFYTDSKEGISKTYLQFWEDINSAKEYCMYCKSSSYYEIFKNIVLSLLLGKEIILLDSDFSEEEVHQLISDARLLQEKERIEGIPTYFSHSNFIGNINKNIQNCRITLFTSGTTGLPKKISHTFNSMTRQVRQNDRHKDDVWGYAYNPTHMAGLQVFFQALLNENTIVRIFGLDKDGIVSELSINDVTNISATPTFYRMLLPADCVCPVVKRITSGGEKFDAHALTMLHSMFPNAKITNVYALTEAGSIFASQGNEFIVKEDIKDLVKVEDGELYLYRSLLGISESLSIEDG